MITDYNVLDANGEALGEINEAVKIDNRLCAVVEVGGVLGIGAKNVAIPLSSMTATEWGMTAPNDSKSQVEVLEDFDGDQYPELEDGMMITVGEQSGVRRDLKGLSIDPAAHSHPEAARGEAAASTQRLGERRPLELLFSRVVRPW